MKIFGIENDMEKTEIQIDINKRNFLKQQESSEVIHVFESKNKTKSAIIVLPSNLYYAVRNNKRIYFGHKSYRVIDDLNIMPCLKCIIRT